MSLKELPDNTLILDLVIPGRPATKKTSQQMIRLKTGRNLLLPSPLYLKYEKNCKQPCLDAWANKGFAPLDFGLGINIKVYLDSFVIGDETGYQQAIGDIIEHYNIIANDKYLHWVSDDTHMINIDKDNPRMEIKLYRYRHPCEEHAEAQEKLEQEIAEKKKKRLESQEAKQIKLAEKEAEKEAKKAEKEAKPKKPRKVTPKNDPEDVFTNLEWME